MNNLKRTLLLIITASFCSFVVQSAPKDDFVITVKTNNNLKFTIPTLGNNYNYGVDCNNDGIDEANNVVGDYSCDYGVTGLNTGPDTYTIRIKDNLGDGKGFGHFYLNDSGDKFNLKSIDQWGTNSWTSMENAFHGASLMQVNALDSPNLQNVTSLNSMFYGATSVNLNTSKWDVSTISDMSNMFEEVTLSTQNYNANLKGFALQILHLGVVFDGGNSVYCGDQAQNDKNKLENAFGWIMTDGGACEHSLDDFVITVKTNNQGDSSNNEFTIPVAFGSANFSVDCNNDSINEVENANDDYTCDYGVSGLNTGAGTYTIRIKDASGNNTGFPGIVFNNQGDKLKILTIEQWGSFIWTRMAFAYVGAANLVVTAIDAPNLSQVSSLRSMFHFAYKANPDTSNWNTVNVTNLKNMFNNAHVANPDTSNWDVSNVTTFQDMFSNAYLANPDTSQWVTTRVENLGGMFVNAQEARPDTTNWDISQITDIFGMFNGVELPSDYYDSLLIDLASKVVQQGLSFSGGNSTYCSQNAEDARNQLITNSNWTIYDDGRCRLPEADFVITVTTDNLGTSSDTEFLIPTNGAGYYYSVDCNDDGIDDAVEVSGDYTCDYGVSGLNLGTGTYTIRIKQDLNGNGFPTIYFNGEGDHQKIINLNQWGTGNWSSFNNSFRGTTNMQVNASDTPNLSEVEYLNGMFSGALLANPDTTNWDTSNIISMGSMFDNAQAANPNVTNWDTGNVINMSRMFRGAVNAIPDTINWNTAKVEDLSYMFEDAISANPNTTNWNTSLVSNMSYMFSGAINANPETVNWNTINVNGMGGMFTNATTANPKTQNWNTENITHMNSMFKNAINANPETTMWNLSNLLTAQSMFEGATNANPNTSNWDTSNVIEMTAMFKDATSASPNTSTWITSNVTRMDHMFDGAISANPVTDTWDVSNIINMTNMFLNVTLLSNTYDSLLNNFSSQSLESNMDFHAGNSRYCSINGQLARAALINNFSWNIIDGGLCDESLTPTSAPDLLTDTGISSTDNTTSSTELEFAIECTSLGNTINLYSNNPFPNFLIVSHTCNSVGFENLQVNFIDQGVHIISYTETNSGIESGHSPSLEIVVDSEIPNEPSCSTTPSIANNGTEVTTICINVEEESIVTIPEMTCSPPTANNTQTVSCSGIVGNSNKNIISSNDTVTVTDVAGNINNLAVTGLEIDNIAPTGPANISSPSTSTNDENISIIGSCGVDAAHGNVNISTLPENGFNNNYATNLSLDAAGGFELLNPMWNDGTFIVNLECSDRATNSSQFDSVANILIDTIAPNAPIIDAVGATQLLISGTAEVLSEIEVLGATCMNVPIIVDNNEDWQCNLATELNEGTEVSAIAIDSLGNASSASNTTVIVANNAPSFNLFCDLDATDVTSEIHPAINFQNYIRDISVGPNTESSQTYTLEIDIVSGGDPDSIIADLSIENENDISLTINTENIGVATVQITMQDDGGVLAGGDDSTIVEFNIHNYPDLNFDPNYMHLDLNDILYKNTFDTCR